MKCPQCKGEMKELPEVVLGINIEYENTRIVHCPHCNRLFTIEKEEPNE